MFRWLANIWGTTQERIRRGRVVRFVRGRYDAAVTTDDNRRHWANADGLSANAANSAEVRRVLRNRARYEVANNSYAKGIVLTIANAVVGTGPRLQLLTNDGEANTRIEREFTAWAKAIRLAEKLRTMRMARITDGEVFAVLTSNPRLPTPVQLDVRLIEADQIATPDMRLDMLVDGIVFDEYGNPVEYHVLKNHPGDSYRAMRDYDRVPAESVLHWFRCDRPGQSRGIPEITPALPLFAQLRRFTLAVLSAAETAADFAGILYTDAPAGGEADAAEPFEPIELEKRALVTMPSGWKMSQLQAEQPTTGHKEFVEATLNEILRCVLVPFNVGMGNSSGYNYASGRLDHQTFAKAIRVDQSHLEDVVLDRILAAWLDEAALIPGLLPDDLGPLITWPHQWFWDGHEHVDPAKEATAQAIRLANHTTTLAHEYARQGRDWEEALRQRAKEIALMRDLGLIMDQVVPDPSDPEDPEEEEFDDAISDE
jgi:lambda family phage portal protein